jgi:hypothetical protein
MRDDDGSGAVDDHPPLMLGFDGGATAMTGSVLDPLDGGCGGVICHVALLVVVLRKKEVVVDTDRGREAVLRVVERSTTRRSDLSEASLKITKHLEGRSWLPKP